MRVPETPREFFGRLCCVKVKSVHSVHSHRGPPGLLPCPLVETFAIPNLNSYWPQRFRSCPGGSPHHLLAFSRDDALDKVALKSRCLRDPRLRESRGLIPSWTHKHFFFFVWVLGPHLNSSILPNTGSLYHAKSTVEHSLEHGHTHSGKFYYRPKVYLEKSSPLRLTPQSGQLSIFRQRKGGVPRTRVSQ